MGLHPNGFQDRLVMTASICLRINMKLFPNGLTLTLFRRVAPYTPTLVMTAWIYLRIKYEIVSLKNMELFQTVCKTTITIQQRIMQISISIIVELKINVNEF